MGAKADPEDDDDDDIPELEEQDPGAAAADGEGAVVGEESKQLNRAEKKSRKMMQRLGMRPVSGIARVTLKTAGKGGFFAIEGPDVYEKNGTYVVFGEARQGGGLQQQAAMQQARAAQQLQEDIEVPNVADEAEPAAE